MTECPEQDWLNSKVKFIAKQMKNNALSDWVYSMAEVSDEKRVEFTLNALDISDSDCKRVINIHPTGQMPINKKEREALAQKILSPLLKAAAQAGFDCARRSQRAINLQIQDIKLEILKYQDKAVVSVAHGLLFIAMSHTQGAGVPAISMSKEHPTVPDGISLSWGGYDYYLCLTALSGESVHCFAQTHKTENTEEIIYKEVWDFGKNSSLPRQAMTMLSDMSASLHDKYPRTNKFQF